jgi:murein DD-endopeptidase
VRITPRGLMALILWCVLYVSPGLTQERQPITQSVDMLVPFAPVSVVIDGRTYVVHELHLTNFLSVDVSIVRLQLEGGEPPNAQIASFSDSALQRILGRPGLRRGQAAPHSIGPGMRAVVYFWVAMPTGSPPPRTVRHQVVLDVQSQSGAVRTTIAGGSSMVSAAEPLVLDAPLRGGPWVAIYDPLLIGGHRTATYTIEGRARIPARFAIDWIRLPASGTMEKTTPPPADWNGFGADVLSVADGVVASAVDDMPDNEGAPTTAAHRLENASGNYIAIDIGQRRFAFYEHLKRGSLTVKAGDRVKRGQIIAQLGNSGSSSIGPHLHFHISDANSTLGAEGLPFAFRNFVHLGAFTSINALIAGERWTVSTQRENIRSLERPAPNAVLRFP